MPTASTAAPLPLAGLTVLDISSFIAAPVAATVLGDYGADVIKVEPPGEGDPNRHMRELVSYPKSPVNYPWHLDARGKRSIALDLKADGARAVLDRLIAGADVLITNYPRAVRGRLRLRYEDVAPVNARLIYASFTGYGETGPDADQVGFDSTAYFARSGLADGTRYEGQPPGVPMPAQGDRASSMTLVAGIMMALWQRERTGRGLRISSSLMANGIWSNAVHVQAALVGSSLAPRPPRERPRNAVGNVYRTRDDRWMQLSIVREEKDFPIFCAALGRTDLLDDPRFAVLETRRANAEALTAILDAVFAAADMAHWHQLLSAHAIPMSQIGRPQDLVDDPQAVASGSIVPTGHTEVTRTIAAPFTLDGVEPQHARPGPALGGQTDDILRQAGYSAAEIAALRRSGGVA